MVSFTSLMHLNWFRVAFDGPDVQFVILYLYVLCFLCHTVCYIHGCINPLRGPEAEDELWVPISY